MSYINIKYTEFAPYFIERIASFDIKKYSWNKIEQSQQIELPVKLYDERTTLLSVTRKDMPFDAYVIPRISCNSWISHLNTNKISNSVYILYGPQFIYVGKSVNSDRLAGHILDEHKDGFYYQMLFVPNNNNKDTSYFWVTDFMAYLESLMIKKLEGSDYLKNKIDGKALEKSIRDLNMNDNKSDFANNVVDLIFEVFVDISYHKHLLPVTLQQVIEKALSKDKGNEGEYSDVNNNESKDDSFLFRNQFIEYDKAHGGIANTWNSIPRCIYLNTNSEIPRTSIQCIMNHRDCRVELVGWGNNDCKEKNEEVYDLLISKRENIESEMGCQLEWNRHDGKAVTRVCISKRLSFLNADEHESIFKFFTEYSVKFYDIFVKYYKLANKN